MSGTVIKKADETDVLALTKMDGLNTKEKYWLSCQFSVTRNSMYNKVKGFRMINEEGKNKDIDLYMYMIGDSQMINRGRRETNGLRPCISLKTDVIKIIGGNGTEENPYIIGR